MMIARDFKHKNFTCVSPQCTVKSAGEEMIQIPASFGGPMKTNLKMEVSN